MKRIETLFFITILITLAVPIYGRSSLADALDEDFKRGAVTRAQYVAYQLMGIQNSEHLPSGYRSLPRPITRLGTGLAMEARALADRADPGDQTLLRSVLSRPSHLPHSLVSPSTRFRIHYASSGPDAASDAFIILTADAYDYAYRLIVEVMGYPPPPRDDVDGPEYDVYVYNIGDYGYSTPDAPAPSPAFPYGYTSYIQMDNDFVSTYTKGIEGMQVTAAHEFFHMVQLGMRNFTSTELDSRWFFEACATWMEDVAFDDVNDYLQYLPYYLDNLHRSLRTFNGLYEYGAGLFFHMLEAKHGHEVVRRMWENIAKQDLYGAIDAALRGQGSSLALELADHMVWNYFTGERADPARYYPEGEAYPLVKPHLTQELQKTIGFAEETQLLSARYVQINPQDFGSLTITPNFSTPANWLCAVISQPLGLAPEVMKNPGSGGVMISDVSASQTIMLITVNVTIPQNDMTGTSERYQYDLSLGDSDGLTSGIKRLFPNPLQPSVHQAGMRIDVRLIKRTRNLSLFILNESGMSVYRADIKFDVEKNGDLSFFWDGRSNDGTPVPAGIYYIYVNAGQEMTPAKAAVLR